MSQISEDWAARHAAFEHVRMLTVMYGDVLPWRALNEGFKFKGKRITLLGQRGIWSPAGWKMPLSIRTGWTDPYGDVPGQDGLLQYRYFKTDPSHRDNVGLRNAMNSGTPLIYFKAIEEGVYAPIWPMLIVGDDPANLTFQLTCEDVESLVPGITPSNADEARRTYVTRMAMVRLHQGQFRHQVLSAYRTQCAICRLQHKELLDAAHIIGDKEEDGHPIVPNGLALCKIHHAAFDSNILGIRPDCKVEIRADILQEVDGPMLKHGLQELHGSRLVLPTRPQDRPDPERLERRFEVFQQAS